MKNAKEKSEQERMALEERFKEERQKYHNRTEELRKNQDGTKPTILDASSMREALQKANAEHAASMARLEDERVARARQAQDAHSAIKDKLQEVEKRLTRAAYSTKESDVGTCTFFLVIW